MKAKRPLALFLAVIMAITPVFANTTLEDEAAKAAEAEKAETIEKLKSEMSSETFIESAKTALQMECLSEVFEETTEKLSMSELYQLSLITKYDYLRALTNKEKTVDDLYKYGTLYAKTLEGIQDFTFNSKESETEANNQAFSILISGIEETDQEKITENDYTSYMEYLQSLTDRKLEEAMKQIELIDVETEDKLVSSLEGFREYLYSVTGQDGESDEESQGDSSNETKDESETASDESTEKDSGILSSLKKIASNLTKWDIPLIGDLKDKSASTYSAHNPNTSGTKTIDQYMGASGIVTWLNSHSSDTYYLGTPFGGSVLDEQHCMRPNGDHGSDSAMMNCTGFVAHVFKKCGANLNMIGTRREGHYCNASNWNDFVANNNIKSYRYDSVSAALSSGVLKKGDLIYFEPKDWNESGADCHIGFFWGSTSSENKFWHSSDHTSGLISGKNPGNQISKIIAKTSNSYVYVFPINHEYQLTLNPNSGSFSDGSTTAKTLSPNLIDSAGNWHTIEDYPVTRTGYTLSGWYDKASGGEKVYDASGNYINGSYWKDKKYIGAKNLTVYAQWTQNEYQLTLNPNGGSFSDGSTSAKTMSPNLKSGSGNWHTIEDYPVSRSGYTLSGWYDKASGGEKVYDTSGNCVSGTYWSNNQYKGAKNLTVYAQWTGGTYTVKYNGNGNTGGSTASSTHTIGVAKNLTKNGFTKTGYTFKGWSTSSSSSTVKYTDQQSVTNLSTTNGATVNLYAVWEQNAPSGTYTVKYNGNGNTGGSTASSTHTIGVAKNLTKNGFTKTGYTFKGWSKSSSSSTVSYTDQQSVTNLSTTNGATVNLYAVWEPITYTVKYNGNGNTGGSTASSTHTYGVSKALTRNGFTKTGYTFQGWSTSSSSSTVTYTDQQSVTNLSSTNGATVNLYAVWEQNAPSGTYTVKYNGNGNTGGSTASSTHTIGVAKNLTKNGFTKTGYTFKGWSKSSSSSTVSYTDQQSVTNLSTTNGATVNLYAVWEPITYTVKYNGNGNTGGSTASSTHTYGVSKALTRNGFTKTNCTFRGWSTSSSSSTVTYTDGESVTNLSTTNGATVNLYAVWAENAPSGTYTVKYNGNGNTGGSTASSTHTIGVAKNLTKNGFTKTGYTFKGWSKSSTSSTVTYTDQQSVTNLSTTNGATVNLYAVWSPITYTVKYNGNGSTSGSTASSTHTYNLAKTLTQNGFTRTGYTFMGWSTSSSSSTVTYTDKQSVKNLTTTNGATVNLYAVWEENTPDTYTVVYNGNGNTGGSTASSIHTIGVAKNLTKNGFTKTGYTFKGWSKSSSSSTVSYRDQQSVTDLSTTPGATVNLYAVWSPITYTVKYNGNGNTSGSTASSSHTYGIAKTLTANGFVRTGYTFKGWSTSSSSTTVTYTDQQSVSNLTTTNGATVNLYAVWNPITYTVKYNGNGNTGGSTASSTHTYDVAKALTANGFTKTGYTFQYWNTKSDGSGTSYANNASVKNLTTTNGATVNLYAIWEENAPSGTYTVKYNGNGNTGGSTASSTHTIGVAKNLTKNGFTKTGYTFQGWSTSSSSSTVTYTDQQSVTNLSTTNGATVNLYAVWSPITYTVKYNGNGSTSGSTASSTHTYGVAKNLTANGFVKTGYTFKGWNTKADGSGTPYADKASVVNLTTENGATVILYAQWKANTYVVEYHGNGATSGTMPNSVHTVGVAKALNSNTFARTGYMFKNWNTNADGSGTTYQNGASVTDLTTAGSTIRLYAQWIPITYTVSYNGNGNTGGSTASSSHTYDATKALTLNGYTRTGYTFAFWNTKADGSGTSYENQAAVKNLASTNGATITLYAQWTPNTYTVTYDGNGNTGGLTANSSHTYDVAKALTSNGYTRTGYTFKNWNTEADGSGASYNNAESVKNLTDANGGTVTLYAQWTPITYTVAYNGNGNTSGSTASSTHTYDVAKTLTANGFAKTGSTFKCWNTKADGTGTTYADRESVKNLIATNGATVTLYAQWTSNTYTVVYDGNGATGGSTASSTHTYGVAKNLTANGYTRTGYTFKNWNTAADGSGTSYADSASVINLTETKDATVTLYAQWTANTYTIVYKGNGSTSGSTASSTHTYNVAKNLTANGFARTGYAFTHWNTKADGSGDSYANSASVKNLTVTNGATITLYAQWTPITYTVKYDGNGSTSGSTANSSHVYDVAKTLTANGYARTGYTFKNWNTKADGSGTSYANSASVKNLAANDGAVVTLYAQWTANTYTIAYNSNKPSTASGAISGTTADSSHIYDVAKQLTANGYSLTGWTFTGWNTKADGSGYSYENSASVKNLTATNGSTIVLYAQWRANAYTVSYNSNKPSAASGTISGTTANSSHIYDVAKNLTANGYSLTGWTFAGWNTKADGSGKAYADKASVKNLTATNSATITLYAQWEVNTYTVFYNSNRPSAASGSISGTTASSSHTYDVAKTLTANGYSLTGWTFTGWNTKADGTGTAYENGANVKNLASADEATVILYAQWRANTYTVIYNSNKPSTASGTISGTTANSIHIYDVAKTLTVNGYSLAGYTFAGWNTKADGSGTSYANGASVKNLTATDNGTVNLYAQWTINQYTLTVNPNTGVWNGSESAQSFTQDYNTSKAIAHPTKKGYTFSGWTQTGNPKGKRFADGYTSNTGTGTGALVVNPHGTYTNYQWQGISATSSTWNHITFGDYSVNANDTVVISGYIRVNTNTGTSLNLYHGAKSNDYGNNKKTIGYADGWQYFEITRTFTEASTTGMFEIYTSNLSGKTGTIDFDVKGLTIKNTTTGTVISDTDVVVFPAGNVTLTANWTPNTYTVAYNGNGNTGGSTASSTHTYDTAKNLTANGYTKTGYTFKNWNTKADGSGTSYENNASVKNLTATNGATVTLYAQWTPNTYTVTYNSNKPSTASGTISGTTADSIHTYDVAKNLTANGYSLTGWTFTSWNTKADGSGTTYENQASVKNLATSGTVILYAQWRANTYTVTYNSNKPSRATGTISGTTANSSHTYDVAKNLTANGYSLTGWTFAGWNTKADGSGKTYANNASVKNLAATNGATVILYAQWTANQYQLTLNPNHGSFADGTTAAKTLSPNLVYDDANWWNIGSNSVNRTGYIFDGWYDAASGGEKVYDESGACVNGTYWQDNHYKHTGSLTVYAHWIAKKVVVTFHRNTNTSDTTTAKQTFTYDVSGQSFSDKGWSKTGYTLLGWSADQNATSATYAILSGVTNAWIDAYSPSIDLYAVWQANTYTVKYDGNGNTGGSTASSSHTYDVEKNLTANGYTKDGYRFKNWNTMADGSGTAYADRASVKNLTSKAGGTVTLYAQWTPIEYTVTFNGNGATSGSTASQSYTFDTSKALTANGFVRKYTVTFDANGGTGSTSSVATATFNGWEDRNSIVYKGTTYAYTTFDAPYYSNTYSDLKKAFGYNKYKLLNHYINNGKSEGRSPVGSSAGLYPNQASVSNLTTTGGATVTLYANWTLGSVTLPTPSRTGYTFAGWYDANGNQVTGTSYTPTADTTLTAHWTANTYTVTYNSNKPSTASGTISGTTANSIHTYDVAKNLTANGYSLTGWTFTEWNTKADGTGTTYEDQASVKNLATSGTVTLYAQWKANTYTVVYNGNGSTHGTTPKSSHTYDVSKTLNTNGYMRIGYTFKNWNTKADGSGTTYADGASVKNLTSTNGGTVTLYAQWTLSPYTISYTLNGGTVSPANPISYSVTSAAFTLTNPTKTGYTFKNWTESISTSTWFHGFINLNTGAYQTDASYPNSVYSERIFLKSGVTYTLSGTNLGGIRWRAYKPNGTYIGSVASSTTYTPTEDMYVHILLYEGATEANRNAAKISSTHTMVSIPTGSTGNRAYVANWTANTYTVVYNSNKPSTASGTIAGTTASSSHTYDVAKNLTANGYSLTGWTFTGWNTNADGTGTSYADGASVKNLSAVNGGTVTLYAQWKANAYTVTYNSNKPSNASGTISGATANSSHTYDVAKNLTANGYSLTGWTFTGWNTKADGSGKAYADKASVVNLASANGATVTLYAQWRAHKYTIEYKGNGNTGGSMASTIHTYDTAKTLTANGFTKTGYTFVKWTTNADGTGNSYADKASVKNLTATDNGKIILYAQWNANTYTVKYDGNGATEGSTASSTHTYDTAKALTLNGFKRTHWLFKCWNTKANGSGTSYSDGETVKNLTSVPNGTVTLYAQWTPKPWLTVEDQNYYEGQQITKAELLSHVTATDPYFGDLTAKVEIVRIEYASGKLLNYVDATGQPQTKRLDSYTHTSFPDSYMLDTWGNQMEENSQVQHQITFRVSNEYGIYTYATAKINVKANNAPKLDAVDQYFTLEEAQNGVITEKELLEDSIADGRLKAEDDEEGNLSDRIVIKDFDPDVFTSMDKDGYVDITYEVTDTFGPGSIGKKDVEIARIYVIDTYLQEAPDSIPTVRFINKTYYEKNKHASEMRITAEELQALSINGGLKPMSLWYEKSDYTSLIESTWAKDTGTTYVFDKDEIQAAKDYIEANGIGNTISADGLKGFFDQFLK